MNQYVRHTGVVPRTLLVVPSDPAACCAPVTAGVLDIPAAERLARTFKALRDPARVRLVSIIAAQPNREACVCDLTGPVGLSQPTVSHHLKILTEAGVLAREERGRWAYFRLVPDSLRTLAHALAVE